MKQRRPAEKLSEKADEELGQLNAGLEQWLAEGTAEVAGAKKQLEVLSFALSHELRAPLRAMEGFSQILLEDHGSELPQQLQDYLKTIQEEARRTAALIEDLIASSEQNDQPLSRSRRR